MNTRPFLLASASAAAILTVSNNATAQVECWGPGMSAPVTLTEYDRSATITLSKPFRCDIFGVAGKLELGDKAQNATVKNGVFKQKLLGGLLGTGPTVQSTTYVVLQTGLTQFYPENFSVSGSSPGASVGPVMQYGENWTLSDPRNPANVSYGFHLAGSSLLGSLLPGLISPANYNLNPKGYFYILGEYHEAPPVMTGSLAVSSEHVLSGVSVNVSYEISRYDTPIYRPPFLGLDLGDIGLTVLGSPPQDQTAGSTAGAAPVISTGDSNLLHVTRSSGIGMEMIPENNGAPTVDIVSAEEFLARRSKAAMDHPEPRRLAPEPSAFGLMEMSTAIQNGTDFILAPRGAVLFCPAEFADRIVSRPQGNHVDWLEFLRANRNWITTFEVTEDQVKGKTPVPPETLERFQNGRISVSMLAAMAALCARAGAVDLIRQIQLLGGEAIVYDRPIASIEGEIRSEPIEGDGSIFQLYAYEDPVYSPFSLVDATVGNLAHANVSLGSHLVDLNVAGIQIDIILGDDSSGSPLPQLLDEQVVGTYIPGATITLNSGDPYRPVRTRADQPYSMSVSIDRLPLPDQDIPAGVPTSVVLEKSYKIYHPTLHVPTQDGSGQGSYSDGLEFDLNGTYTLPEIYQHLPGVSPIRVIGEETFTASVRIGDPGAKATIGSATIQIWPVGTAEIQGIAPDEVYRGVPTGIQVVLTDLYPDSVTYAQIYKGSQALGRTGYVIPSSVFSINTFAPQNTTVPLLDLENAIDGDGTYTIEVLTITPFNNRQPERVAYTTFDVKRTIRVNGMVSTMDGFEHEVISWKKGKPSLAEKTFLELGADKGWEFEFSKDGSKFTPEYLAQFDAIIFYTSGDLTKPGRDEQPPMTAAGKQAIFDYVKSGKGFIGIHSASDTFHTNNESGKGPERYVNHGEDADPYVCFLGAEFITHGAQQEATNKVIDNEFPGFENAGDSFTMMEEWYSLKDFRDDLHCLTVIDSPAMKGPMYDRPAFPTTWARAEGKGRVYYTAMGHRPDVWTSETFRNMLVGAIKWTTGEVDADIAANLSEVAPGAMTNPKFTKKK
eukprot:g4062.t1